MPADAKMLRRCCRDRQVAIKNPCACSTRYMATTSRRLQGKTVSWQHSCILLFGGLEHVLFFHILGMENHPNWLSYFSEGLKPPSRLGVWSCFLEDLLDHERSTLHVGDPFLPGRSVSYVCFVPSNRCTTGNHALLYSTSAWVNTP